MVSLINKNQQYFSDYVGIVSSFFCLLHCMLTPVLFSLQILFLKNTPSYNLLEYFFLILSFLAVLFTSRKFIKPFGKILIWSIYMLLSFSIIFHEMVPIFLSYAASITLILLHFFNIIYKKLFKIPTC
jgi:hypothetical protein